MGGDIPEQGASLLQDVAVAQRHRCFTPRHSLADVAGQRESGEGHRTCRGDSTQDGGDKFPEGPQFQGGGGEVQGKVLFTPHPPDQGGSGEGGKSGQGGAPSGDSRLVTPRVVLTD